MCTYEYPFGDPFMSEDDKDSTEILKEYKRRVLNEEPDYSKIPKKYTQKTTDFIKLLLTKERKHWPLIKDIINDLEEHAQDLFSKAKAKIKFPPPSTSWRDI